jgi:hypothetical protein
MLSQVKNEALGDWRNFKGDHYHLVYALWALIYDGMTSVAFYQGNDLLVQPPLSQPEDHEDNLISLRAQQGDTDLWVQLKSSANAWTSSALIDDTLANFTDNVIRSERKGKQSRVLLVSQGQVQKSKIEEFCKAPDGQPDLYQKLNTQVTKVHEGFQAEGLDVGTVQEVRAKALAVLREIAEQARPPKQAHTA